MKEPFNRTAMRRLLAIPLVLCACAKSPHAVPTPQADQTIRIPPTAGGQARSITMGRSTSPFTRTVNAPLALAWNALPRVYATLGIPVTDRDVSAHALGATAVKLRRRLGDVPLSRYLECGSTQGAPSADTYEVLLTMETRLHAAGTDSTVVVTTMSAMARPVAFSSDYISCGSRGGLERRFFEVLGVELTP